MKKNLFLLAIGLMSSLTLSAQPSAGTDMTESLVKNYNFTQSIVGVNSGDATTGWRIDGNKGGGNWLINTGAKCGECWSGNDFDFYQIIEGAPAGVYQIEVQGFTRAARDAKSWGFYFDQQTGELLDKPIFGDWTPNEAHVYLNDNMGDLSICYAYPHAVKEGFFDSGYYQDPLGQYQYPSDMHSAGLAFAANEYTATVFGLVENEGDQMRIGVKGNNYGLDNWAIFTNFRLIYQGSQIDFINSELQKIVSSFGETHVGTELQTEITALVERAGSVSEDDVEGMRDIFNEICTLKIKEASSEAVFAQLLSAKQSLETTLVEYISTCEADLKTAAEALLIEADEAYEDKETGMPKVSTEEASAINENILFIIKALKAPFIEHIYYNLNAETKQATVISSYTKYSGDIKIPETIIYNGKTYSVTTIADNAFNSCSDLTSISIPNNVTSIGNGAFNGCDGLTKVEINSNNIISGYNNIVNIFGNQVKEYIIGESVTSIGEYVFSNCISLTSVTIGNSVKSIGTSAFYGCTSLSSVNIGNSVIEIGSGAFSDCSVLTSINIPNSVTTIGNYVFSGCSGLSSVTIGKGVTKIGVGAFDCNNLKSVHISNLAVWCSISFGNGYGSNPIQIAHHLYLNGEEIKDLVIPDNVTSIGQYAFDGCESLTSVTIPNSVTTVGKDAFDGCNGLKSVNISDLAAWCNILFSNKEASPLHSGASLYLNDKLLQGEVNIPEGALKIGSYSFYGLKGVSKFIVPSTVQTIEQYAFNSDFVSEVAINATSIISLKDVSAFNAKTAIYVQDDLVSDYREASVWKDIKDQIFIAGLLQVTVDLEANPHSPALLSVLNTLEQANSEYKISTLTNLKIRGTINGWDILMIRNKMPNLRNLDLGEATILDNDGGMEYYTGYHTIAGTISPYMFYEVDNLRSIVLPEDITYIGEKAFGSSGLQRVSIPGTVKEIGYSAFSQCYGLISLELNKGLETINREAFYLCYSLREISLPSTLKRINQYAFCMCSSLKEIDFSEGLEEIGYCAFQGCSQLNNLHLPTSLTRIDSYAFNGCSSLTEVHVPSMITEIGDYAFKDCGLKSVYAYTVVPIQINQNTFDYDGVDLYAPANSFYAYYLNTQWSQFLNVKEFDALYTNWYMPKNTDLEIDTDKPIQSEDEEIASDGDMNPGSGLIITGDGEQEVNELVMDCENGESYPSVIENNNLNVEELTFKMDVRPGRWYFFSFPFDVVLKNIKYTGKSVWRYYDGQTRAANGVGGWKNTVGELLKANQGYIFQCNAAGVLEIPIPNPEFSNSPEKEVPLQSIEAKNPQDASWNFIGNPNLSYYGIDDMAEKFEAPITVWNDEQQTYTAVVPGDDEYHFHPFEAFFVQTPENVDNLTFEDENRVTYSQAKKKGESSARSAIRSGRSVNEKRMLVNLTVSNGQTTDKTRIIFNDDNKLTYETGRDANKFMSMADVPQIYTIDAQNVKYSVNARPNDNRQVRLGFVASSDGEYTIEAERMDCSMVLKDNQTGTIHQLDGKPYTFYSEAGTFDNRFTLMSGMNITSISANGLDDIDGFNVAAMDGGIVVTGANDGDLNVYNANGVKAATLQGSGTINLNNGTYIVTYAGKSAKIAVK